MAKILLVDDNRDILMVLRVTFEGAGHEVVATEDPLGVLALATEHQPDACVLDVMMPERSGWDVLEEIRKEPELKSIPVVLLTALSDVNDRVKGLRGGADDYQIKPFEPEELLARVEGLIARQQVTPPVRRSSLEQAFTVLEGRIAAHQSLDDVRLGRFRVRDVLGRGAMGTVLRGWDPKLERPVALKTIRFNAEDGRDVDREKQVSQLLREAMTNARVHHPNIVTVFDVADEGRAAFIAMELVEGRSLETHLEESGPVAPERLVPLAAVVARALAAAHDHGVIHRDVKPGNVLLGDDGSIKVTDFGISELLSRADETGGSIFGTPGYLAPESLTGEATTTASDLFALGATLYECLTGLHPFVERNWRRTLHNTILKNPPPLTEALPDVPPRAGAMIMQLLEKQPTERPGSAGEVAEVFEEIAAEHGWSWKLAVDRQPLERPRIPTTRSRILPLESVRRTLSAQALPA